MRYLYSLKYIFILKLERNTKYLIVLYKKKPPVNLSFKQYITLLHGYFTDLLKKSVLLKFYINTRLCNYL